MSTISGLLYFFTIAGLFIIFGLSFARVVRPHRPNPDKLSTYESGEEPIGDAMGKFSIKYFAIALFFLLFEVELILLFPWVTISKAKDFYTTDGSLWVYISIIELGIFLIVLTLGLAYAWTNGYLDWNKPTLQINKHESGFEIPQSYYDAFNKKYT